MPLGLVDLARFEDEEVDGFGFLECRPVRSSQLGLAVRVRPRAGAGARLSGPPPAPSVGLPWRSERATRRLGTLGVFVCTGTAVVFRRSLVGGIIEYGNWW